MLEKKAPVTTFVYRSKATQEFDPTALDGLVSAAQSRNAREGITGVVAYDNGKFFQWLEGPRDSIDRVSSSIQRDGRHTDIDVVWVGEQPTRMFTDWSMQLAVRDTIVDRFGADVVSAPDPLIDCLHSSSTEIAALLSAIPRGECGAREQCDRVCDYAPWNIVDNGEFNSVVSSFVIEDLIPQLYQRHVQGLSDYQRVMRDRARYDQDISPLVERLLAPLAASDEELINGLQAVGGYLPQGFAKLYRRVCANLAQQFEAGKIMSFDISLALSVLQVAFHRAAQDRWRQHSVQKHRRRVLVAHFPGDPHLLGTTLKSEILHSRGWPVDSLYPDSSTELLDYISKRKFDVIVLPLSRVFMQSHLVRSLEDLISRVRKSSDTAGPAIVVGGRLFATNAKEAAEVNADSVCWAIDDIEESVCRALENNAAKQGIASNLH